MYMYIPYAYETVQYCTRDIGMLALRCLAAQGVPDVHKAEHKRAHLMAAAASCMAEFQSVQAEELTLLPTLLRIAPRAGVFMELGALDGVDGSHTLLLEKCFNWTGILMEAQPTTFAYLSRAPRRSKKFHAAACKDGSNVSITKMASGISVVAEFASKEYIARWGRHFPKPSAGGGYVQVPCMGLATAMQQSGFAAIDFLSLDVQGAEDVALSTVDPTVFKVILVEAESTSWAKTIRVRKMLTNLGFRLRAGMHAGKPLGSDLFLAPGVPDLRVGWADANATDPDAESAWRATVERLKAREDASTLLPKLYKYKHALLHAYANDLSSATWPNQDDIASVAARKVAWKQHMTTKGSLGDQESVQHL